MSGQDRPTFDPTSPIFFMIGSQRSGSNWLRTMLNEREDLAGPHPPHIMRDYMPIIDKFGDVVNDREKRKILLDHVCTFVERNQVAWTDKHGLLLQFNREKMLNQCEYVLGNVSAEFMKDDDDESVTDDSDEEVVKIENCHILLAIFDTIHNTHAVANDKRTWICKSMGMSQYHKILLEFYGKERLRYIYMYRDPRDVAMSFMKTPVGDCHYYAIVTKWIRLQGYALQILAETPDLVHQINYEALLVMKKVVMDELFEYIGQRRFGWVGRKGSVLIMKEVDALLGGANAGGESTKAAELSSQFRNLTRGDSFAKKQLRKWLNGDEPLNREELVLIESIAHKTMDRLGYGTHVINVQQPPSVYSAEEIAEFDRLNVAGIKKMNEDLAIENPGDATRRNFQKAVLSFEPTFIDQDNTGWKGKDPRNIMGPTGLVAETPVEFHKWPLGAEMCGYLTSEQVHARMTVQTGEDVDISDGYRLRWAAVSQTGYYPSNVGKPNEDSFAVKLSIDGPGNSDGHIFSVFDGHGPTGDACSQFASEHVPELFATATRGGMSIDEALVRAHMETNEKLTNSPIDHTLSGTTSNVLYLEGRDVHVANVGDSQAMVGSVDANGSITAKMLSEDHTLYRRDEVERIKKCGGRVMTVEQLQSGVTSVDENWSPAKDQQPRLWAKDGKYPGTAFTRSIGDGVAESLGVVAQPECTKHTISSSDRVLIVASDGCTDFLSPLLCVERALTYKDPLEACKAIVGESYRHWIKSEDRCDDLTVIVMFLQSPPEVTVTNKKGINFYARAARSFLQGVESKDGEESKAAEKHIIVSGLGNAISCAVAVATQMETEKIGTIGRVETHYPNMQNGSNRTVERGVPQIHIVVNKA